jgi:hypothetical protein
VESFLKATSVLHQANNPQLIMRRRARGRFPSRSVADHYLDFRLDFFAALLLETRFGTFCPAARASERPIAIACFRLVTFLPERPLFSVPALRSFIARSTLADAFFEYLRAMITLRVAAK